MAATPAGEGTSDDPAGTSDTSRICFELSNGYTSGVIARGRDVFFVKED
ncbi:hypothetical protein [Salipaludibacillus sp. CF4.18]